MSERTGSTFRLEYRVSRRIAAPAERVWRLLTHAGGWPSWNGTVTSLEGEIAVGNRLKLRVPIAPDRTFKPKVVELAPERRMVWRDGALPLFQGTRTFTLAPDGTATRFEMVEVFRGLVLPMIRGSLPDMREPFDRFAADLAAASERD